jgi:hypothetical protein
LGERDLDQKTKPRDAQQHDYHVNRIVN